MAGFFTHYSRFGETSEVAADIERLNFRFRHVIEGCKELLAGKSVLDIASHDGRFSFASLRGAGAKSVVGIEARAHLVEKVEATFAEYEVDPATYKFIIGDVFEEINKIEPGSIETAMVLGFLYHTARQYELISSLSRLGVKNIIVDSNVIMVDQPYILLRMESTKSDAQIWDSSRQKALSSTPSALALELLLQEFGYSTRRLEANGDIPLKAKDYERKTRVTIVGTKV